MRNVRTVLNGSAAQKAQSIFNDDYYNHMINNHIEFIEKQCFKAVRLKLGDRISPGNTLNIENEALELSNRVLDTLRQNNYRVLKEFKGNAQLTTYLSAIISRHAVDLIRKKLGRGREKERAKELGDIGLTLYQRVIKDGYSLQDVFNELRDNRKFPGSLEELEAKVLKIKGKNPGGIDWGDCNHSSVIKNGTSIDGDEYVIPDTKSDPQVIFMEKQRHQEIDNIIQAIISRLTGEEKMLLHMRFPFTEDEKPKSVEQIAAVLAITPKAVYKRLTRLMKKCKEHLDQQGVTVNELL